MHFFRFFSRPRASFKRSYRPQVELLEQRVCLSTMYDYTVIAQTDGQNLIGLGSGPSINDSGQVAFTEYFANGSSNIFVGDVSTPLSNVSASLNPKPDPNRSFGATLQINNTGEIAAVDTLSNGSQKQSWVRIWSPGTSGYGWQIVDEADPGPKFDSFSYPVTINNASVVGTITHASVVAYSGKLTGANTVILDRGGLPISSLPSPQPYLDPMIADNGSVVARVDQVEPVPPAPENPKNPIELFVPGKPDTLIAGTADFDVLGASPGISDDGQVATFYGDLTLAGATNINTAQPDQMKIDSGPGIFASISSPSGGRIIVRIAGEVGQPFLYPGETFVDTNGDGQFNNGEVALGPFKDFSPDSRVAVTSEPTDQNGVITLDAVTISYLAYGNDGNLGLYTSRLDLLSGHDSVSNPSLVAKVGGQIPGLSGNISRIWVYDPINQSGQLAFWVATDSGTQAVVQAKPERTPLLLLPGIGGTFAADSTSLLKLYNWVLTRGTAPSLLQEDPLANTYTGLIKTLVNAGYHPGVDLFVANYDWRVAPSPVSADGSVQFLTPADVTADLQAGRFESGVDYLAYWLKQANAAWSNDPKHHGRTLDSVDIIAHSTGGLVTRAYIQSAVYGQVVDSVRLPTVDNLIMLDVPNQGASKAFNPLFQNNWHADSSYILVLSKLVNLAYQKVLSGLTVLGPSPAENITLASITDPESHKADPVKFVQLYVPTLRYLLPTYDFLDEGNGVENLNSDPNRANWLLLALNGGKDHHGFATATGGKTDGLHFVHTTAIYGSDQTTETTVVEHNALGISFPFDSYLPAPSVPWFEDVVVKNQGDGTVPLQSLQLNDDRVDDRPFTSNSGAVSHTLIVSANAAAEKMMLDILGQPLAPDKVVTQSSALGNISNISGSKVGTITFANIVLDPVDGFLVDGEGRRLGYSAATGVVTDIPNSEYFGGSDGIGFIAGPITGPLTLELTGTGGSYYSQVGVVQNGVQGGVTASGTLASGVTSSLIVAVPPSVTTNPTSQIVGAGSSVTLSAAADGSPIPSVQWQVSTDGGKTFNNVAGATSTTITFTAIAAQNHNRYCAVFSNSAGTVTTTAASLTVATTPIVTTNPTSHVVSAGNPVALNAAAVGGPAPTVQWQMSTDTGQTFTNISGATSTTLTFTSSADQNDVAYRAVFTNSSGSATTTPAFVTVNATPANLVISDTGVSPQFNLVAPPGSGFFGGPVVLSTGNIVMTDSGNGGAAYLFNGQTGALISALTGLGVSPGPTVTALTNGNYVVDSPNWHSGVGAVTWGSGTTGVSGTPSAANSLIGSTPFDYVGGLGGSGGGGVTALPNGNYVVSSPSWGSIGTTLGKGAVTWGNGTTGTCGVVSAANSFVGASVSDNVGTPGIGSGVTVLANGNYLVSSINWGNGVGAVTWGNGTTGTHGPVSSTNSLVGTTTGSGGAGDNVGWGGVTALTNGNYVVDSSLWNGQKGAVTWGNGATGITGVVSTANSLVGSNAYPTKTDLVGYGGVTALTNGNYVVASPHWAVSSSNDLVGAVTWGNGATGITGVVSTANSLVGSNPADLVGGSGDAGPGGVTVLTNGNYVVDSPSWGTTLSINAGMGAEILGAVTWESGTAPAVGTVSAANSLVGTIPSQVGTSNRVGQGGVVALTNGNYVVDSPSWSIVVPFTFQAMGAVTWGNGTTGITGTISAANSLVGSFIGDAIGGGQPATDGEGSGVGGVTALANGNYVVDSPGWLKQSGAVTWADGTTGLSGTVSADNSLVGDAPGDAVGNGFSLGKGVTALANGNYVVLTPNKATATWGNGKTRIQGTLSTVQSLGGVGGSVYGVNPLPNGNYVVAVNNGNGNASSTWVDGTTGATLDGQNTIDAQNSLMGVTGAVPLFGGSAFLATDAFAGTATVGITDPNLLTYALGQGQTINITPDFLTRTLDAGTDVTVQSNDDIIVNSPITEIPTETPGSLTLESGLSIILNASINTAGGNLNLIANDTLADGVVDTERDPGNAVITEQSGATINTGAGFLTVDLMNSTDKTNNGSGSISLPNVIGSESLASGTALGISINGTTPGDGVSPGTYTQLNLTGSINLNDAALSITHSASTPVGTTFIVVQTTGGVTGTFSDLAEGASMSATDGTTFTVSYQGNGGKNVVLTQTGTVGSVSLAQSIVSVATSSVQAGSADTVTLTARDGLGNQERSGGLVVAFGLAGTSTGGSFSAVTDNGNGTYTATFTPTITGNDIITATIGNQPVTSALPSVNVTPGPISGFRVSALQSVTVGKAFTVSVTAFDQFQNLVTNYAGTVHFSSSDSLADLPADYTFVAADGDVHLFIHAVTLATRGTQTVTATDVSNALITGQATMTVTSAPPPIPDIFGRVSTSGQIWGAVSNGSSAFNNNLWATWNPAAGWIDVQTGDFNGDGKADIVGRDLAGNWWVGLSNGSSFSTTLWGHWNPNVTWVDVHVGNFTGDGKADIVGRALESGQWWLAESTGSSFTNSLWATWNPAVTWVDVNVGDFNGDGKTDITGRWLQGGSWWTGISTGTSLSTTMWAQWNPNVTWVDVQVGDFNGEGQTDITGRVLQSGQWWVGISSGSSFTNSLWATWNPNVTWVDVKVGDFNGDGMSDIVGRWLQGGQWWTSISTGTSFSTSMWASWNPNVTWIDVQVGDFNGDGKDDITGRYLQGGSWWTGASSGTSFNTTQWAAWSTAVTWVDVIKG
jgi:hypothetical protein